ncbi:MAG: hypothetical protein A2836_00990 [Candidatus Taylorbacteria bacterium RIFCSPHIGHO2_01_FULL_45_63]|nr:MAG: hypothetical protein A2836_00990 [Candidatus Taylorbacteria bacterium RIFCSPHIGHO2_01_FULL_45_63]
MLFLFYFFSVVKPFRPKTQNIFHFSNCPFCNSDNPSKTRPTEVIFTNLPLFCWWRKKKPTNLDEFSFTKITFGGNRHAGNFKLIL